MKILFCDNNLGQFLNFRGYIARYYHSKGIDVGVVLPACTCTDALMSRVPDYLHVYTVDMKPNSSNPIKDLGYLLKLYSLFRQIKPDIIFLYTIKPNIYGSIAGHMLGIPVVAMVAGLGYAFSGQSLVRRLGRRLYKYGLQKAEKVIVLNQSNYDTLCENGFVEKEKLLLFEGGEGVDMEQYPYKEDNYTKVRFLMVARILYDKGYSEYVDAARIVKNKYPDIKIELLGPLAEDSPMGVPRAVVEADHNSGAITYLGETNDVPHYVGKDGVVVVVVSSYKEGLNRSLMEACSMGRICITSDIPGCKEIVDNGLNGLLVEPKNPERLANAMIDLIERTPEKLRQMSELSHNKAMKYFDIRHVIKKYDCLLSEFVSSK